MSGAPYDIAVRELSARLRKDGPIAVWYRSDGIQKHSRIECGSVSAGIRSPRVYLRGEETAWHDEHGRYLDWIEVKIRCDSHEQSQAVGKVVSLMKRHNAEEIVGDAVAERIAPGVKTTVTVPGLDPYLDLLDTAATADRFAVDSRVGAVAVAIVRQSRRQ